MTTVLALNEGWTLTAVDADPSSPAAALPSSIPATVPGTVHTDLLAAGWIPDPYLDENELLTAWIGHTTWAYRTTIAWTPAPGHRTDLAFDGLDTVAVIRLNGVEIGRTFNQHRSYRFDVSTVLHDGANELEVRFDSAWDYAEEIQATLGDLPNAYPSPFNFIRKMAANFGWDWGPQLVTAGIWKDVRLESWSDLRLAEVCSAVTVDGSDGLVAITAHIERRNSTDTSHEARLRVGIAGTFVDVPVHGDTAEARIRIPDVDLWWPRDLGTQPLYDLTVTLLVETVVEDAWNRRVGFRTVVLDTSEDETGSRFTFVINGVPTFVRGANWIPDDCFPSRLTESRYRDRILQAVGANLNLLRVWGGGIYERNEFYEICDELGVMTWQDFLFACAAYPEEAPIRDEVVAEARDNVIRLSSHPSLVLWNGCNENLWAWFDWDWQESVGDRTWGLGYYTEILPAIVAELDSTTPYWPGSPFSGSTDIHPNEFSRGNVHIWDVWNRADYRTYADHEPRFVSEFGFQGPATWSTIERSIHDVPLTPESRGMLLHQKADDGNGKLQRGLEPHLPSPSSMEEWHYLTQLNQSRAVVYAIERYRSQRPQCMGTIVWQLNDCWPVTSWAAIDGDGRRKPLWHGLRRANAPRLVTIQPTADGYAVVAINDGADAWEVSGIASRETFDRTMLARESLSATVSPGSSVVIDLGKELGEPENSAREALVLRVNGVRPVVQLFEEDKHAALLPAEIEAAVGDWHEGAQTVTLTASTLTRGVSLFPDRLLAEAWVDDVDVDLFAGETHSVTVFTPHPLDARALTTFPVLRSLNSLVISSEFATAKTGRGAR